MKKVFTASDMDAGKRLDAWLCLKLEGSSRKRIKRLLDSGGVKIGGKRVYIAGWKLKSKDRVEILEDIPKESGSGYVNLIYEDRDIIVVDKPAGILSVTEAGSSRSDLESRVKTYLKRKFKTGSYLKPLHRLDAETSGPMVFAKSKAGEKIEEQFRYHNIERRYVAVVEGVVLKDSGRIDAPLEKGDFGGGKKVRAAGKETGRWAVTEYRVKERYPDATLLEISVHTGRTHQIRVHLAGIGHPIIGDKIYGSGRSFWRQALHAARLGIRHPVTGKKMKFESPLPKDFRDLVDELRGI